MKVIVDATVWSLAFRRSRVAAPEADVLSRLLRADDVALIGVVRQEALSGIKDAGTFRTLRDLLRKTPDHPLTVAHYEAAADGYNVCRRRGVQGSHIDFLVCAASMLDRLPIFTTDRDFGLYAKHLPITLFDPDDA